MRADRRSPSITGAIELLFDKKAKGVFVKNVAAGDQHVASLGSILSRLTTVALLMSSLVLASIANPPRARNHKDLSNQAAHTEIPAVDPRHEDVATIDGIIRAAYETMAGPAGQPRQWGRNRTLFSQNVYFVQEGTNSNTKKPFSRGWTYQEYADNVGPALEKNGFFEHELGRSVHSFGRVACVLSAWETSRELGGKVLGRGVNIYQLVNDGERWWITSINWDNETAENPIPKELISAGNN